MKARYQVAGMISILLLLAIGLLWPARSVSAAADGKITGTVKLNGAAPHMKGIDMSKDPFCVKQHENNPAHWRMWWWGRAEGWRTLCCTSPKV